MKTALFVVFCLVPALATAQVQTFEEGRSLGNLTSKDLIPKLEDNKAYSERYTFSALLDDGGEVYLEMTISNFGWGNFSAATATRVLIAGETPYAHQETMKAKEWSYNSSQFQMTMGKSSVAAMREGTYKLEHRGDVEFELEFKNILPAWRPGNGEVRVGSEYFRLGLIAPRASVTGRVKIGDAWKEVSSRQGMADWSVTTMAPFDFASEFGRFRAVRGDTYVAWRNIRLAKDHGGKDITWVIVGKGNQIIFADANASLERGNIKRDSTSKYDVPHRFVLSGKSGETQLNLRVEVPRKFQVVNLLDSYGTVTRFLAARFTKPFQFNAFATWTLRLEGDEQITLESRGPLGIDILN